MDDAFPTYFSVFVERHEEGDDCRVVVVFEGFEDAEEAIEFSEWFIEEIDGGKGDGLVH